MDIAAENIVPRAYDAQYFRSKPAGWRKISVKIEKKMIIMQGSLLDPEPHLAWGSQKGKRRDKGAVRPLCGFLFPTTPARALKIFRNASCLFIKCLLSAQ